MTETHAYHEAARLTALHAELEQWFAGDPEETEEIEGIEFAWYTDQYAIEQ